MSFASSGKKSSTNSMKKVEINSLKLWSWVMGSVLWLGELVIEYVKLHTQSYYVLYHRFGIN
jgi:hypothetical protein